jgi:hypothetical protein
MAYARAGLGFGALAGIAGVVFACSSTPGPLYPAVTDFCTAYATSACGEAANCIAPTAACESEQSKLCIDNATSATADGRRVYTPNNAPACVNQAQTVYSNATVTFAAQTSLLATCAQVFAGNVALGGTCSSPYDCAGVAAGVTCASTICVQQTVVQPGPTGFCGQPSEVCAVGSYCNTAAAQPVCTVDAALDQLCSAGIPCGPTLRCTGTGTTTCQARSGQGEPCATNDDCDPSAPLCDVFDGFICTTQLIFSHGETALCQNYGLGSATPFDAGTPPIVVSDASVADTGVVAPADGGTD